MRSRGNIVILSGPSGVGKGTIIKGLTEAMPNVKVAISATTRKPRSIEANRKSYYFLSDQEFDEKVANNEFLEWCHVLDKRYGTLRSEVENTVNEGKDILLEIDTEGAQKIKANCKEAVLIFIAPPTMKELQKRLVSRQTEQAIDIQKRLKKASLELAEIDKYDYVVINKDINKAIDSILSILKKKL